MTDDDPENPSENKALYDVGYGKPPKHSQFKKGNKYGKGRQRGGRNLKSYVKEAMEAKVPAKINGKMQKLSKIQLGLHQLANKASSGDLKAIIQATTLYERHCPPEDTGPDTEKETSYELETLRHFLTMKGEIDHE